MQAIQYKMNLPADVHRWLKESAARSLRSVSSEIIFTIRHRMDEEAATGAKFGDQTPAAARDTSALQGADIHQRS